MQPFERKIAPDGHEVMLFPLTQLYVTQGENGSYSHQGILAMDLVVIGQHHAPIYAPCSCTCVAVLSDSNNGRIFQSNSEVWTPAGLQYVNFMFFHDNNPIASVGRTFTQGDLIAHTGTAGNVTGDHTHFNTAYGTYAGWTHVPPQNHGCLVNSSHIYETCYIDDTLITNTGGYTWVTYGSTPPVPTGTSKHRFKWVLYANKFRNRNYI